MVCDGRAKITRAKNNCFKPILEAWWCFRLFDKLILPIFLKFIELNIFLIDIPSFSYITSSIIIHYQIMASLPSGLNL